jgi:hypothetical protein
VPTAMTMPSTEQKTEPLQIPLLELPPSPKPPPASKPSACASTWVAKPEVHAEVRVTS